MHDGVAIGADRPEVLDGIDAVSLANLRQRREVMHMNESGHRLAISLLEAQIADCTARPVMGDAALARSAVPFVAIDDHGLRATF